MRKAFKQLPFESKIAPRGKLLCMESKLRVNPSSRGAMTPVELQQICAGLADNTFVQTLDLDGNQFALGWEDANEALTPVVQLVDSNRTIQTLDISNNGLSFAEENGLLGAVERIICRSNLTCLVIGGNMDIDDVLMEKLGHWVAASGRRWKGVRLGSVDADFCEAVEQLKTAVRTATAAAETRAIGHYFKERPAVEQQPAAALPRAAVDRAASPRREAPTQRERSRSPEPAAEPPAAAQTVAGSAAGPPGASELRCQSFLAAFHEVRGDEDTVEQDEALAEISAQTPDLGFSGPEMEFYLRCMVELNFIMISDGTIYII